MRVLFTMLTTERHRLEVVRGDESRESVERSFLLHDLVHHAFETEANLQAGFYGLLARGTRMAELADRNRTAPIHGEIALAETLVGPMQSVWKGRLTVERYVESVGLSWVDEAFVSRVRTRLRALVGRWRATPHRQSMELSWPPPRDVHPGAVWARMMPCEGGRATARR